MPLGHYLNKPPVAQQVRLDNRRKLADAGTGEQRGRETSVLVYGEVRLKRHRLVVLSVGMSEFPAILGPPKMEREQPVLEKVLWCSRSFSLLQIGGARDKLMPVGQYPARDQRRVL